MTDVRHDLIGLCLAGLVACDATAAQPLTPPAKARRDIDAAMAKCFKSPDVTSPVGHQLVAAGLQNCYDTGKSRWEGHITRAKQRLEASVEPHCAQISAELEAAWGKYQDEVSQLPSLGAAPLNAVDDVQILLLAHRYETLYAMTGPFVCPLPK